MINLKLFFLATIILATYTLTAQVSVTTDGTDPDGSAMLEVRSTEKGMLIPRMTQTEIEAITSPANGLTVFCTTDDTFYAFILAGGVWKEIQYGTGTIAPYTPPAPPVVGDSYGGGIVAYIFESGDPGYVMGETHGLIASTADLSTGIQWYNGTWITTNATGTALGTGSANTDAIITVQGPTSTDYAAGLCRAYSATGDGGLNDWYLPSKDELNKLRINRWTIGGFATESYWSSSEVSQNNAWGQYFVTGNQNSYAKNNTFHVRAVRAF